MENGISCSRFDIVAVFALDIAAEPDLEVVQQFAGDVLAGLQLLLVLQGLTGERYDALKGSDTF